MTLKYLLNKLKKSKPQSVNDINNFLNAECDRLGWRVIEEYAELDDLILEETNNIVDYIESDNGTVLIGDIRVAASHHIAIGQDLDTSVTIIALEWSTII